MCGQVPAQAAALSSGQAVATAQGGAAGEGGAEGGGRAAAAGAPVGQGLQASLRLKMLSTGVTSGAGTKRKAGEGGEGGGVSVPETGGEPKKVRAVRERW